MRLKEKYRCFFYTVPGDNYSIKSGLYFWLTVGWLMVWVVIV